MPKLYLKAFQSAPKRIHLHNLNTSLPVKHASLKDQCYRRKFYGQTDQIEDALASLENSTAPLLQSIVARKALPTIGTAAYETLVAFVGLQLLRTTIAAKRIDSGADKMTKQAYAGDPRLAGLDMASVHVGYQDPVLASLRSLPDFVNAISDLHGHLVVSSTPSFLTSDNPAFKYNQYCEEIRYMGITGGLSRGLQIFMPLAPSIHLVCTTVRCTE